MDVQEVLKEADKIVFEQTGKRLDDLQCGVIKAALNGQKYSAVSENLHRSEGHVRDVAYELWKILSGFLGEEINKSNFRTVMEKTGIFICNNSMKDSVQIGNLSLPSEEKVPYKNEEKLQNHTVSVNADLQLVVSSEICESLGLTGGQELKIVKNGKKLEIIPVSQSDQTTLIEKMRYLREQIVESGMPLLSDEEIEQQIQQQRQN